MEFLMKLAMGFRCLRRVFIVGALRLVMTDELCW
jgi:hypothetical protein